MVFAALHVEEIHGNPSMSLDHTHEAIKPPLNLLDPSTDRSAEIANFSAKSAIVT